MAKNQKGIPLRLLVAVLLDGVQYQPNTVLLVDEVRAKSLVGGGQADDSDAAVEYALTLGELVTHVVPAPAAAETGLDEEAAAAAAAEGAAGSSVDQKKE